MSICWTTFALVLLSTAAACSKKENDKPAPSSTGSAAPSGSAAADTTAPGTTPPTPPPADEAGIDVCSWVPKEEMEKVLGGKITTEPERLKKMGSQLGGCTWQTEQVTIATVTPRPAGEFDGTVSASGDPTDVPGVGEKAVNTSKAGLLVKVAGKPYFLHIMVVAGAKGLDKDKSVEVAKVVVPAAK